MRRKKTRVTGIVAPAGFGKRFRPSSDGQTSTPGNLAIQNHLTGRPAYRTSHKQDAHEREAGQLADRVMNMNSHDAPATSNLTGESAAGSIQRKSNQASGAVSNESSVSALQGSGHALSATARSFFEPRFGRDLGHVRIHDDNVTHQTAKSLNARAFTQNNHIGFDSGQYDPDSREGKHLLAHELAHVNQQTDANTVYCENWHVDDTNREIEREILVQLIFKDTVSDWWNNTGWTTARKNTFRGNFVSSIENTFNNSSIVINPPASAADVLPREAIDQGYKPLVDIDLVPDGETSVSEDWEVDVESNPTGEFRTSSSSTSYGELDEADNTPITKTSSAPGVKQIPTVHEFGHFIGLDHPGEGLEGGIFSDSQLSPGADEYSHSGTDSEGRTVDGPNDLMGGGMGLQAFYYDAWAEALDDHIADLRRAEQQRQFQRDWNMFERALGNDPAGVDWFIRGMSGM